MCRRQNNVFQTSLQFSIDAAKLARITGVHSLISEWQGRELVKSAAYLQLSEND